MCILFIMKQSVDASWRASLFLLIQGLYFLIMTLLERINALGTTVVVVTHERGLVNHFDKRVITINDGIVAGDGMGQYEVAR